MNDKRMTPPQSPWVQVVGPCYTVTSFSSIARMEEDEVRAAASELRVLLLVTADGSGLLPSFQVREERVVPHLHHVLEALRSGIDDPWTWAQWLNTRLGKEPRPIDSLWAGELERVVTEAERDAWAWRR